MSEKVTTQKDYSYDIEWITKRIDRMEKKLRLIMAIMIDKKLVSEELGKVVQESKLNKESLVDWLMKELDKKK